MNTEEVLSELVQLRVAQLDRDSLLKANNKCIAQLAQLQIKASQIALEIQSKDREVARIHNSLHEGQDLNTRLRLLELENQQLKSLSSDPEELKSLTSQVEAAKQQKDRATKKFRETLAARMLRRPLEVPSTELKEKKQLLQQNLQKMQILSQEAKGEVEYLKSQVIPVIQRTLALYEQNKHEMREELQSLLKQRETDVSNSIINE